MDGLLLDYDLSLVSGFFWGGFFGHLIPTHIGGFYVIVIFGYNIITYVPCYYDTISKVLKKSDVI